uniref:Uncharacterized protein n=1 Tax=Anguilla anguilla TaxID=7936 RepID=A0A0E9T3V2_ANGAN
MAVVMLFFLCTIFVFVFLAY